GRPAASRSHSESGHDNIVVPPASSTSGSSSRPKVSTPSSTPFTRTVVRGVCGPVALSLISSSNRCRSLSPCSTRLQNRIHRPPWSGQRGLAACLATGSVIATGWTVARLQEQISAYVLPVEDLG